MSARDELLRWLDGQGCPGSGELHDGFSIDAGDVCGLLDAALAEREAQTHARWLAAVEECRAEDDHPVCEETLDELVRRMTAKEPG